jgi:LysR family transcriptional regulator, transcriptional activator for bauABCD operon
VAASALVIGIARPRGGRNVLSEPRDDQSEARPIPGQRFARNLDWNLLRTFHEIARAGGLSQAARATSRKQPALSMALRRLEDLLGARLCQRGPGGFCLTQEGEMLAKTCDSIFGAVTRIPTSFANATAEVRGRVRIQMINNLVDRRIDRALGRFHSAYPSVEIFVNISTWEVVPRTVLRNEADIGLAPAHVRISPLRYELLFSEVYRPYCGRSHPLHGRMFADPGDLAQYPLIHTGADEPEQLTNFRNKHGIGRRIAGLSERLEEARRLTLLGTGICFLPEGLAAPDVADGGLHALLERDGAPSSEIFLISGPDAPAHRARDLLLDFFRQSRQDDQAAFAG